jgi:hypothetical protein
MTSSRLNILWPFLIILVGIVWLMQALGTLPSVVLDLIGRAWPVVLVAVGLILLVGRRLRFGNLLVMIVCVALVGGVITTAYGQLSNRVNVENRTPFLQTVEPDVTSLRINTTTLLADIEVVPENTPTITGEFAGSFESIVTSNYQSNGGVATFTLLEAQDNPIPALASMGKGKLTLRVPSNLTIEQLTINGREGNVQLDISALTVKNLAVNLGGGNLIVKLADKSGLIAEIKTGRGGAAVTVPPTIAANITLRGAGAANPEFNAADYTLSRDLILVSKRAPDPQMQISIEASGKIIIQ